MAQPVLHSARGRPPSILTSQAASQRGTREPLERSRSRRNSELKTSSQDASARRSSVSPRGKDVQFEKKVEVKEGKEVKEVKEGVRARSLGEKFLPPNHLKILLDDPQAALPKSQVKIRSQGLAFSQASQMNFRQSQEDFEKREDVFKLSQERELLVSKKSGGILHTRKDESGG